MKENIDLEGNDFFFFLNKKAKKEENQTQTKCIRTQDPFLEKEGKAVKISAMLLSSLASVIILVLEKICRLFGIFRNFSFMLSSIDFNLNSNKIYV